MAPNGPNSILYKHGCGKRNEEIKLYKMGFSSFSSFSIQRDFMATLGVNQGQISFVNTDSWPDHSRRINSIRDQGYVKRTFILLSVV